MEFVLNSLAIIVAGALIYIFWSKARPLTKESVESIFRRHGCTMEPAMSKDAVPVPITVIRYQGIEIGSFSDTKLKFRLFNKYNPQNTSIMAYNMYLGDDTEYYLESVIDDYFYYHF
jgi:hypothetical protein